MLLRMNLRRLGHTELRVSAIGLGGHWRTHDGRRYYDRFERDEVPAEIVANRREVVAASLEAGINYIDVTTAAECAAYGQVLRTCRDRFVLGADDYQWSARNPDCCHSRALIANVERCLTRLQTDHLDIWRVTAEVHGRNSTADVEAVIEAADRLRQAGKIRELGVSSHHPGWIRETVERSHQFQVAMVPCTPLTCHSLSAAPLPEPFRTFASRGIGLMTIKPFAGGLLFDAAPSRTGLAAPDRDRLARLALRQILHTRVEVSCVLVGLGNVREVRNAVEAASAPPPQPDELAWLAETARSRLALMPPEYQWLSAWHDLPTR